MSRVLVTGATGFVGGRLATTLAERGLDVRCLVRNRSRAAHLEQAGMELHEGDVLDRDSLRGAGLSRAKVAAVKDIAAKTRDGLVPTPRRMAGMEDAEIVERLTTIRGVGQWTVEMLLIFKLGRMDVDWNLMPSSPRNDRG